MKVVIDGPKTVWEVIVLDDDGKVVDTVNAPSEAEATVIAADLVAGMKQDEK